MDDGTTARYLRSPRESEYGWRGLEHFKEPGPDTARSRGERSSDCGMTFPTLAGPARRSRSVSEVWEIDEAAWDQVRERVHAALRAVARRRATISYSALVADVGGAEGQRFDGADSPALARMLGQINSLEPAFRGKPLLLSAVVVHRAEVKLLGWRFRRIRGSSRQCVPGCRLPGRTVRNVR